MKKLLLSLVFTFSISGLLACTDGGGDDPVPNRNACSVIGANARIISGTACDETMSPVVEVVIVRQNDEVSICSGSMLTSDDVLTAAHCVPSDVKQIFIENKGDLIFASRAVVHPQAGVDNSIPAFLNDAAILMLSRPVDLPTLPLVMSEDLDEGDIFSIFGFGLDDNKMLETLRSGQMKVSRIEDDTIFAEFGDEGSNTCSGDSGGPALLTFEKDGQTMTGIVGLTSAGLIVECTKGDTSLFAYTQARIIFDFIIGVVPDARVI